MTKIEEKDPLSYYSYWDYQEAAKFLHITVASTRRLVMQRRLPCYRPFGFGGKVLFNPQELKTFVEKSKVLENVS